MESVVLLRMKFDVHIRLRGFKKSKIIKNYNYLSCDIIIFRAECFNTPFFGGCVKALLMEEMEDELRKMKTKIG